MEDRQLISIDKVKENPDNPRIIKDKKFKSLVKSIKEFPEMADVRELVVNTDYVILGGNMRFKAMKEAGWKEVPVRIVNWSEEKQQEFVIKDNVSGGEWDWDSLANQYNPIELEDWGMDLPVDFNSDNEDLEDDETPEIIEDEPAKSVPGQIYMLGDHRILCGSATDESGIDNLLRDKEISLLLTDPPYNVDYTGKTKDALKIENDKMDDLNFQKFLTDANRIVDKHMKPGSSFYIFHADSEGFNFRSSVKNVNWMLKQCLIWVKQSMVMGRQDYQWKHEPILYGWKPGASHNWYSDRKQTTVLEFDRPSRNADHPTMKPLKILAYLINNSSRKQEIVFDSFLGSGSTLIASHECGRICYGTEIDPRYVDVIRKRYSILINNDENGWEEFTPAMKEEK